jgi:hypothetical protein
MTGLDSTLDTAAIGRARALLKPPLRTESLGPSVAAAAFAAAAALALAFSVVMAPPVISPGTRGELPSQTPPERQERSP